jgi:hypothetical protein
MELLFPVLSSLVTAIPVLIVDVTLVVVAVSRWNRHPRVSMLAAFSGGLMLVLDLLGRAFFTILPLKLHESGKSAADLGIVFAITGGISSLLHAVALGLLVAAVFAERPSVSPPQGFASFSGR